MFPEEVKKLRGELSQAEFATILDVARMTVHRWELPMDHSSASRPRGKNLKRLIAYRSAALAPGYALAPPPEEPLGPLENPFLALSEEEAGTVFEVFVDFFQGSWRIPLEEVAALGHPSAMMPLNGKSALRSILLLRHLWERFDETAAGAVAEKLVSALAIDPLRPEIKDLVHAALALYHAWPTGGSFDARKTGRHAGAVLNHPQAAPLFSVLAKTARLQSALQRGDRVGFEEEFRDVDTHLYRHGPPLIRAFGLELLAVHQLHRQQTGAARKSYETLRDLGHRHNLMFARHRGAVGLAEMIFFGDGVFQESVNLLEEALAASADTAAERDPAVVQLLNIRARIAIQEIDHPALAEVLGRADRLEAGLQWHSANLLFTKVLARVSFEQMGGFAELLDQAGALPEAGVSLDFQTVLVLLMAWTAFSQGKHLECLDLFEQVIDLQYQKNIPSHYGRFAFFGCMSIHVLAGRMEQAMEVYERIHRSEHWVNGLNWGMIILGFIGLFRGLQGRIEEAEVMLTASEQHLAFVGDRLTSLRVARLRALVHSVHELPGYQEKLDVTAGEMKKAGLTLFGVYTDSGMKAIYKSLPQVESNEPLSLAATQKLMPVAWMVQGLMAKGHTVRSLGLALVHMMRELTRQRSVFFYPGEPLEISALEEDAAPLTIAHRFTLLPANRCYYLDIQEAMPKAVIPRANLVIQAAALAMENALLREPVGQT